MNMEGCY